MKPKGAGRVAEKEGLNWYESTTRHRENRPDSASPFRLGRLFNRPGATLAKSGRMPSMNRQPLRGIVLSSIFLTCFAAGIFNTRAAGADKHPFGLDDYSALRWANAVAVSPDGKSILF